ncbi:MAG: Acetylornithine deacetylase [Chloroflexi bacterium ADurb.Bin325]|nr:MAG: Acetylornithine deacetylase [Chloroflexi bacterium ADurb.Bin325]
MGGEVSRSEFSDRFLFEGLTEMDTHTELTDLLADLVRIDSVNPDLIAGARGEAEITVFIAAWATRAGLEATIQEVAPGRPNVIVTARGSGGGRNLLLNGHMDTVGLAGMAAPLDPRIADGRMYGRGAYDMKAGLAASLIAARRARGAGLRGDVIVACVVDEEVASLGTQALVRELARWQPAAAIVAEPTEMALAVAHKGFAWFDIETFGVAAHGSRPHLGVDAIMKMGRVLAALDAHDRALQARPTHRHLGGGSLHAGVIQGGQELSSYPAYCKLQVERRTVPGESIDLAEAQLQAILDECARGDSAFSARLTRGLARDPFEVAEDASIVQMCREHLGRATGRPTEVGGVSYWADSALLAAAGVPTVLLGPTGAGAHAAEEWVDLASAEQCADIYAAVARELCG